MTDNDDDDDDVEEEDQGKNKEILSWTKSNRKIKNLKSKLEKVTYMEADN